MDTVKFMAAFLLAGLLLLSAQLVCAASKDRKVYVLHISSELHLESDPIATESLHHELLSTVLGSLEKAQEAKVYSYGSFSGFAAHLSADEATAASKIPGVLLVTESEVVITQTTQSWDYLQFKQTDPMVENAGENVIIGVIDTGIWPESKSFNDTLMGPIPSKWRGTCITADKFNTSNCNRKLIGARYYSKAYEKDFGPISDDIQSPRDAQGHGTHCSSIAAGVMVQGASMCGLAAGDARGGAPAAAIAVYKACWGKLQKCSNADLLAAIDDAIKDNVDIIMLSIASFATKYYENSISVGAFHATMKGITVVAAGGNGGDKPYSVVNAAPWIFTVAASSTTRRLMSKVVTGQNTTYQGLAINTVHLQNSSYPLVYSADIKSSSYSGDPSFCLRGSLNASLAKGKIVVCRSYGTIDPQINVLLAGGAGVVSIDEAGLSHALSAPIAATTVPPKMGARILFYIRSNRSATAKIFPTETVIMEYAPPYVAKFSSTGPSTTSPGIIKPDIAAPGINVLAAWSPLASPSADNVNDHRIVGYNIASGTSVAASHVTAVAAFVKSIHPDWSPAAIKSAIMTTATKMPVNMKLNPHGVLASGSGQINPLKAIHPGLVFDIAPPDYSSFLCSLNYTIPQIAILTGTNVSCNAAASVADLNYPSIAVPYLTSNITVMAIKRTVTNVENTASVYKVEVQQPSGLQVTVTPTILAFTALHQSKAFTVNIQVVDEALLATSRLEGALTWTDGKHAVRVPLAVWQDTSYHQSD